MQIAALGFTQSFNDVQRNLRGGGDGNNIITVKGGVVSPVTLYGGFNLALHPGTQSTGHNQLYSADGTANLYAGDGGDEIVAGSGDANIYGGAGPDNLVGGTGKCYIKAGSGNSKLRGGGGISTLDGNDGASDIETAGSGDDTLIGGTGGKNTFIVNDPDNSILASTGTGISITGKGASNQLIISGKGDPSFSETYNYGPGNGDGTIATTNGTISQSITYTGLAPIFDSLGAGSVTLNATSGPDTINIGDGSSSFQENSNNAPTGNNLYVQIDSFEATLLDNKTTVNVYGMGGGDTATIASQNGADGLANLNLFLGSGTNAVNVQAMPTGVATTVDGTAAGAANTFNVGSNEPSASGDVLDEIQGALTIKGSGGSDTLNVSDIASTVSKTGTLTSSTITGMGMGPQGVAFSGVSTVNVTLGGGSNNQFNIQSTLAGVSYVVSGSTGTDTFFVGSVANNAAPDHASVLATIQGSLTISGAGADTMNADDSGNSLPETGKVTATTFTGMGMVAAGISYSGLAFFNIWMGTGGDTMNVQSTAAGTTTTIDPPTGQPNTFNVGSLAPTLTGGVVDLIKGPLVIVGSSADTMNVDDTGSTIPKNGTLTEAEVDRPEHGRHHLQWPRDPQHQPRLGRQHLFHQRFQRGQPPRHHHDQRRLVEQRQP